MRILGLHGPEPAEVPLGSPAVIGGTATTRRCRGEGSTRDGCRARRRERGPRAHSTDRSRPGPASGRGRAARPRRHLRLRRTLPARRAAGPGRPSGGGQAGPRHRRRVRAAAAVLRRPHRRRGLDQRTVQGVRGPTRGRRAHHDDPHSGRGPRPRRADAPDLGSPRRPVLAVRRRDPQRRVAPACRHPRHHPRPLARQHPQVRGPGGPPRRSRASRHPHRPGGAVPRGVGGRRPQHPRGRGHAGRQNHPAELPRRIDPLAGAGGHVRGGLRAEDPACATSRACSAASRASKAPARCRCAVSSRRRCGCGRLGSSSARSVRRSRSTC